MCKQRTNSQPNPNPHHLQRQLFMGWGKAYIEQHNPTRQQVKLLNDVIRCGTEAMGRGYEQPCECCGGTHRANLTCNNRHCSRCHWTQKKRRVKALKAKLPLCSYSLVTVMPPSELYATINQNQKFWYDLLIKCPADAIKEFANDAKYGTKYLGGLPAIYAVLQTSNARMNNHPHSHYLVSNGGERDNEWVEPRNIHWIPTSQVSDRVKELVLAQVRKNKRLWDTATFQHIEKCIQKGHWEVHCEPLGNEVKKDEHDHERYDHAANLEKVLRYLTRDCMASHRIIAIDYENETVTIQYTERHQERWEQETIPCVEYIRRFMLHVLPPRFPSIRSYGLLHSHPSKRAKLAKAKKLFDRKCQESDTFLDRWLEQCQQVVQEQQEQSDDQFGGCCTHCGNRTLKATRVFFHDFKQRRSWFTYDVRGSPDIPNIN